jgi:hypothetical protein
MTVAEHNNGFSMPVGVALIVAGVLVNRIAAIRHHRYIKALAFMRIMWASVKECLFLKGLE